LPPVQQGCEFDSLDTAGDSETKEQPIEMSFHGTPCHIELAGDFGVIASLQKQVYDLLFARTEPNSLLFHSILPFFGFAAPEKGARLISSSHSIHVAISGANEWENRKTIFHRHLQPKRMATQIGIRIVLAMEASTSTRSRRENRAKTHICKS